MYLAVALNPTMNPEQVTEYLTQVDPAALHHGRGRRRGRRSSAGGEFAMRVWLDPMRLAARNVTATDVLTAIRASNFLSAPGKTENEFVAYAIQPRPRCRRRRRSARCRSAPTATRSCGCATWRRSSSAPRTRT